MQRTVFATDSFRLGIVVVMLLAASAIGVGVPVLLRPPVSGALAVPPTATPTVAPTPSAAPAAPSAQAAQRRGAPRTAPPLEALLTQPRFAAQRTTTTRQLSADGYSWAQAWPIQVDQYGNLWTIAQAHGREHHFVYSNDRGQTWDDSVLAVAGFRRGTIAYDPRHSRVHMLWVSQNAEEGVVYARYTIVHDRQKRISGFKAAGNSVSLDRQIDGRMSYEYPVLFWLDDSQFGPDGALLAIWSARNDAGTHAASEVRAAMRVLDSGADPTALDTWQPPLTRDRSSIGNPAQVRTSTLFTNRNAGSLGVAALRKQHGLQRGDLYLFAGDVRGWRFRRATWDAAAGRWRELTPSLLLSPMARAGTDHGYSNKFELASKPVEDSATDRVYIAFPTWKNDEAGDTWSFLFLDAADAPSRLVDVYSAGGPHSFAPTGDIVFDPVTARLIVSYIQSDPGKEYAWIAAYDGITQTQPPTLIFDAAPVDIPLLWQGVRYRTDNGDVLPVLFRDAINTPNPPYHGYFGTIAWSSPAPNRSED
jgi:hypothetical protein